MVTITDLPDETIVRILDYLLGFPEWEPGSQPRSDGEILGNLNLTCRRLSALCTPKIWREFEVLASNNDIPEIFTTAMDRVRNVSERPHLLSLIREVRITQDLPNFSNGYTDPIDNSSFFQAMSGLVRNIKGLRSLILIDCPVKSKKIPQSYKEFWISIFASGITELVYTSTDDDRPLVDPDDFIKWIDPDLVFHMAKSNITELELSGGEAYQSLSSLSFLTNLPKVHDLYFVDCGNSSDLISPLPAPRPSFWQRIRRLTLENLHESVLLQIVDWVHTSRLEAEQDGSAQPWGLEQLDIDLGDWEETSDMRPILARFSTPEPTELFLCIGLKAQLDSSFISYLAELFPSLKTLSIDTAELRIYAQDISNLASGFGSHKNLETLSFDSGDESSDESRAAVKPSAVEGCTSPDGVAAAVKLDRIRRRAEEMGLLAIARSCSTLKQVEADEITWDVVRRRVQNQWEEVVELEPRNVDSIKC